MQSITTEDGDGGDARRNNMKFIRKSGNSPGNQCDKISKPSNRNSMSPQNSKISKRFVQFAE